MLPLHFRIPGCVGFGGPQSPPSATPAVGRDASHDPRLLQAPPAWPCLCLQSTPRSIKASPTPSGQGNEGNEGNPNLQEPAPAVPGWNSEPQQHRSAPGALSLPRAQRGRGAGGGPECFFPCSGIASLPSVFDPSWAFLPVPLSVFVPGSQLGTSEPPAPRLPSIASSKHINCDKVGLLLAADFEGRE